MSTLDDFLKPNSMLTPGIAGGVITLIANTLYVYFALPAKWTALIVSAIIAGAVLKEAASRPSMWMLYYVLNTLIIFSVAMGANTAGSQIAEEKEEEKYTLNLISEAHASGAPITKIEPHIEILDEGGEGLDEVIEETVSEDFEAIETDFKEYDATMRRPDDDAEKRQFFHKW